jgi:hypothetical protein
MVSLDFSVDIIIPIALRPWGRLNLQQKWVPAVFPGGKFGRCVTLTTLPPYCVVVKKSGNLNFLEPSRPPQACNGTAFIGKAVPLQACGGPEYSRKLKFPDYMTTARDDGKVDSLTHRQPLPNRKFSWYSFLLEAESTPRWSEWLCKWKIPLTPSGIEPATFRFVTRTLNTVPTRSIKYDIQLDHNHDIVLPISYRFLLNIYILGAGTILRLYSKISHYCTQ